MHLMVGSQALFLAIIEQFSSATSESSSTQRAVVLDGLTVELVRVGGETFPETQSLTDPVFLTEAYLPHEAPGMRTLWLNRTGTIAPGEMPRHDAELTDLTELGGALQGLREKPTLGQIFDWWEAWELPDNVRVHCMTVAWAAYALGVLLQKRGLPVDPILAHRGGLLHDLDKIRTLHLHGAHGVQAGEFLAGQGYPVLAGIAREHIMHTILDPDAAERRWESKLVYFCDKLVEGDRIVLFDQRLAKLLDRYPHYREGMRRAEAPIWALSDQICSILGMAGHENLIFSLLKLQNNSNTP